MNIKGFFNNINPFRRKGITIVQPIGIGGQIGFATDKKGYIDDGYAGSSTVYSIVSIISETFASAPMVMYAVKNKKAFEKYKVLTKSYNSSLIDVYRTKSEALDEIDGHPLIDLLNKPNDIQGGFDFRVHANASRDITGDTFIYVNRGLTGKDPIQIKILPSQYMNLKLGSMYDVQGYILNQGKVINYTPEEVLHWKHTNLDFDVYGSHLLGQSPLKALSQDYTLSANKEGKKSAAKGYKNQGAGGLLSRHDDFPWGDEQRDQLNEYLDTVVNGSNNRLKVRALNSKVNWVQMAMSAADQKIFEGIQATKEDICNAYNFPVHLISATSATDNNYDTANKYLVAKTCYGRWVSWRDFINNKLLPMYKDGSRYYFDFDISQFPEVQDDQKKLIEQLDKMPITLNEYRTYLGWEKLADPNMDKVYIPTSKMPLDKVNEPFGGDITDDMEELDNEDVKDYK